MKLFDRYIHKLRFFIDKDAPKEYIKRWKEFKKKCESGKNKHIVDQIKSYCKLENNKNLPYLNNSEGGMGGNNNMIHKQIRFRDRVLFSMIYQNYENYEDNDIMFDQIFFTDTEHWTYEELDDLIYAFIKTSNYNIKSDCVNGCIEMINETTYSNYLDSDSE